MPLTFSLTVNGTEYLPTYADPRTIRPTDSIKDRTDTMSGLIVRIPYSGTTPAVPVPLSGQEIVFTRGGVREFAGIIQRVRERFINPNLYEYEVQAGDYTRYFDRWMLTMEIAQLPANEQVAAIVDKVNAREASAGGSLVWSKAGIASTTSLGLALPTLPIIKLDYMSASQAIDSIAKLIGYRWDVDYDKVVQFTDADTLVAPIATIDCETDVTATTAGNLVLEDIADQVVNTVYIKGAKTKGTFIDASGNVQPQSVTDPHKQSTDADTTWFKLSYEVPDLDSIFVQVTPPGGPTTIYRRAPGAGELPLSYEGEGNPGDDSTTDTVYVCMPNFGIRFNPNAPSFPVADSKIEAVYQPLTAADAVYTRQDYDSIADIKARESYGAFTSTGIYEEVIDAGDLINVSTDAVNARGDLIMLVRNRKYGATCRFIGSTGWRSGQYLTILSTKRMGGAFYTQTDGTLGRKMWVMEVTKSILNAETMAYDVRLSSDVYGEV